MSINKKNKYMCAAWQSAACISQTFLYKTCDTD